ncbi:hypothetical protein Nmel_009651, partial [Mimus melanotis]
MPGGPEASGGTGATRGWRGAALETGWRSGSRCPLPRAHRTPGHGGHCCRVPEPHRCVPLRLPLFPPHRAQCEVGRHRLRQWGADICGEGFGPACRGGMETGRGSGQ